MVELTWHSATFQPLMGTVVEVRAYTGVAARADAAYAAVVGEVERLTQVFSAYEPGSELCRWRRGDSAAGPELTTVLAAAADWWERSRAAFHPAVGAAGDRWRRAERDGVLPGDDELAALAAGLRTLPYAVRAGTITRTGNCAAVDLDAFAKGWIVDRAVVAAAAVAGVDGVVVNAGGDLAHRGAGEVRVAVEDPLSPFDNAPPLGTLVLRGAALASSGLARRGFAVGGRWFGHVLDPRTARPVEHTAAATVVGPDTATADAAATVLGVLAPDEARAYAVERDWACLLVDSGGARWTSPRWAWA